MNCQLDTDVQWQPFEHVGTTNQLYSGRYNEESVVLRLNTAKKVLGVCRQREEQVLKLISNQAWAPDVLQQQMSDQSQPGWLLIKYYEALVDTPIIDLHFNLLACVSDWQQIKNIPAFDYQALWNGYQQKIDNMGNVPQAQMLLKSIRALMHELEDIYGVDNCLVHHDLHPGNLLISSEQLIIIDWEYAGLGTPWLDAAALVTEFSISLQTVAALPAFRHLDSEAFKRGINIAQQINRQLNMLWYDLSGALSSGHS